MPDSEDPYRIPAGPGLDSRIHREIFEKTDSSDIPSYSTDERLAKTVMKQIRSTRSRALATGSTTIRDAKWYYARYGSDPSTSTEVLSESLALSICRLALVIQNQT